MGVPGISDGLYDVERHEVTRDIEFPYLIEPPLLPGHTFNLPEAWGNGTATPEASTGLPYNNLNDYTTSCNSGALIYGMPHTEVVPGSVTSTGCRLRTYVYRVWRIYEFSPGVCYTSQEVGFFPASASNVQFAATVLGVPPPLAVSISGPTEVFHPEKGQPNNCYTWTANASAGIPPYTYTWFRNGIQVGTASSYQECFSYNGGGGGSYQITLRVDVRDVQNTLASDTKVVTAYNSGGGAQMTENLQQTHVMIPEVFALAQNYPNPFNPETEISFALPEPSSVRLIVLDVLGREVAVLEDRNIPAGYRAVRWNGRNAKGEAAGSGVYFYRLSAVGESGVAFTRTMKMVMTK